MKASHTAQKKYRLALNEVLRVCAACAASVYAGAQATLSLAWRVSGRRA